MEPARVNPKSPQSEYSLRPTYDLTKSNKIVPYLDEITTLVLCVR